MDRELDNANPTIINTNELPTRRHKPGASTSRPALFGTGNLDTANLLPSWSSDDDSASQGDDSVAGDPIDEQEIYDLISTISDPEHPLTLGQLAVVNLPDISISPTPQPGVGPSPEEITTVTVNCTPTINHCSLATVIGLAVRVRLEQCLPPNYRVDVRMKDGSHAQDDQVNKQLGDKERVAAALENDTLKMTLDQMMSTCADEGGLDG